MNASTEIAQVADDVCANQTLTEEEKILEVATRLVHGLQTWDPELVDALASTCDRLTEIGVYASQARLPRVRYERWPQG